LEVYRNSDELLTILNEGFKGLMSLDTEDKVLRSALNLCMAISKTTSGYIIKQTEKDKWKINETYHNKIP
jgi:hypothetical protein